MFSAQSMWYVKYGHPQCVWYSRLMFSTYKKWEKRMSARILVMKRKRKPHAVTGIGKNMCISDTFWRIMTNTICRENKQTNVLAFTNETQKAIVVQNSWKASANPNNFPIIYLLNLKTLWGLPREILKSKVDLRNNSPHTLCMILRVFCHPDYQFHYLEHFRHHCVCSSHTRHAWTMACQK